MYLCKYELCHSYRQMMFLPEHNCCSKLAKFINIVSFIMCIILSSSPCALLYLDPSQASSPSSCGYCGLGPIRLLIWLIARSGNFNGYLNCSFLLAYPSSGIPTPHISNLNLSNLEKTCSKLCSKSNWLLVICLFIES